MERSKKNERLLMESLSHNKDGCLEFRPNLSRVIKLNMNVASKDLFSSSDGKVRDFNGGEVKCC
ncbi:hypothetical protein MtrunA17_Chr2g0287381 [Medicago truncatula]|nr:hypothetical protein MtrDRAFT_AC149207g30v2 [Medicago truncatula]RHN72413.1 hypothetical protein MtrunA17_Chr2g0287381 [Medicago truncatula]